MSESVATFTWVGAPSGDWDSGGVWQVPDGASGSFPDGSTDGLVNGTSAGATATITGPGTASALIVGGPVNLSGTFDLGSIDTTGTSASLGVYGAEVDVNSGPGTTVTMNGGTISVGSTSAFGLFSIGGSAAPNFNADNINVFSNGTLSGSGSLYTGFLYTPPVGNLAGNLTYQGFLTVEGEIYSTGFTLFGMMDGHDGTIVVAPGGFFSAPAGILENTDLTFDVDTGGTLHLSGTIDSSETIDFAQPGGSVEFWYNNYTNSLSGFPPAGVINNLEAAPIVGFTQGDQLFETADVPDGISGITAFQLNGNTVVEILEGGFVPYEFTFLGNVPLSDLLITYTPALVTVGGPTSIQIDAAPTVNYGTSRGTRGRSYTWSGYSAGAWSDAANWYDTTTSANAAVAPGAGDTATVDGDTGPFYTVITQTGLVGTAEFSGNVSIEGTIHASNAVALAGASVLATNGGAMVATTLTLDSGASVDADGLSGVEASGDIDITGGATVESGAALQAIYGGRIQLGALTLIGGTSGYAGASVLAAPADEAPNDSAITVGTSDDAPAGDLKIDQGFTVSDFDPGGSPSAIFVPVIDDGLLIAGNMAVDGISGTGTVDVSADGGLNVQLAAADTSTTFIVESGGGLNFGASDPAAQLGGASITLKGSGHTVSFSTFTSSPNPFVTTPISGFSNGDTINVGLAGVSGGSWSQSTPDAGTLSLLNGAGQTIGSLILDGSYSGTNGFLIYDSGSVATLNLAEGGTFPISPGSNSGATFTWTGPSGGQWGDAANWTETTPQAPAIAPGMPDTITLGGSGTPVITGAGNAAGWVLGGELGDVSGDFNLGSLTGTPSGNLNVLGGGTLNIGNVTFGQTNNEINLNASGNGALLAITGTLSEQSFFGNLGFGDSAVSVSNGGTVSIRGLTLSVTLPPIGDLGTGTFPFIMSGDGTLILPTTVATTGVFVPSILTLGMSGTGNTLEFDTPAATTLDVAPSINGFAIGDTVDVTFAPANVQVVFTQNSTTSETAAFQTPGGTPLGSLTFAGDFTGDTFSAALVAADSTQITVAASISCFRAGTRIATPDGLVAVEDLRAGDRVLTREGRNAPVTWVGHRHVDCRTHPRPRDVWPVRIRAGAFGDKGPGRDLYLSPDHAVYLDGVLIPARHLCNGTSIAPVAVDTATYYHIELDRHDVVLAEGLAVESYLDVGERRAFETGGRAMPRPRAHCRTWREADCCAPCIVTGPLLTAARLRTAYSAASA